MANKRGERYTKFQTEACRAKIKTSHIIRRLEQYFNGDIELSMGQIRSAEILLNKTLANLSATEVTGDVAQFVMRLPEPAADTATWERTTSVSPDIDTKH
jgi:hypothetical protein